MKDKHTFLRQSKAFNFWLCDTGWEMYPTSQLLAWTHASFKADISPSAKSNQNPISQLSWKPHLQPVQGSLASASSSHALEWLVGRRTALWSTPASIYWTRACSHFWVRHNTCEDARRIISVYANSKSKIRSLLFMQNVNPFFCLQDNLPPAPNLHCPLI